ncbi:ferredoxin--NADP reductase, putative [Plasmodium berghei]|uniref:ferredoxin--NADP(+) reductase n=2 Tax=Plasmodium berghei TaxID=5821 RepID=A0A509AKW5_PLABA|nr:ferredoxin--NADP reductase, putative [Plasmodium berghei ANKA]CXI64222.1 ferredoxin--NADP reductase, putative [Plasmodium berghei]SCM23864.1 ferredoxin--NADP reductase, putative [Plasmodium berghei]SCN26811.1 ferredoxin--NADP reductase, putative [Plasmodium berghei]SCO61170.1 ferredoxin--NADP reductase, putative [Plasmodium berghei]SCO63231.1 ferredoxin--NADP reductase, putative [Plasmodium berghei]|eukprot:XP_034422428.1 ferredoxin--NADP reductase, putative [Plasmodium berghei ANKA]
MKHQIVFLFLLVCLLSGPFSNTNKNVLSYEVLNNNINKFTFLKTNQYKKKCTQRRYSQKEANKYTNLYTIKNPLKCKVVNKIKLVRENAKHIVYNIEINHNRLFKYIEGQSCGIIPYYSEKDNEYNNTKIENDVNFEKNKNNVKTKKCARLYSISSGNCYNLSVAIRIHKYEENLNEIKNIKYGYCSGYIENIKKNDDIYLTGAHGNFILSNNVIQNNTNLILIGTGTGISPYISFLKKLLICDKNNPIKKNTYSGFIHIFYGVYNEDSILYLEELEKFKKLYPNNLHIHYVFSVNKKLDGSSFYVQDEILKKKDEFFHLFNDYETELYICGHKEIKQQIMNILKSDKNFDISKKKKIHVEVY